MTSEFKTTTLAAALLMVTVAGSAMAQVSQGPTTRVQGNTEINVQTSDVTAMAVGQNNVAKNRIGVIKGDKKGDTRINVTTKNVTTIAGGRNKKACTNIGGIVGDECK